MQTAGFGRPETAFCIQTAIVSSQIVPPGNGTMLARRQWIIPNFVHSGTRCLSLSGRKTDHRHG